MATERNNASNNIVARVNYIDSRLRQEEYSQPAMAETTPSSMVLPRGSVQTEHLGNINEISAIGDLRITATGDVTITGNLVVDGSSPGADVIYQPDEPTGLGPDDEGTLWLNPADNVLQYWGGVAFYPVIDPRVEDVIADVVTIADDLTAAKDAVDQMRGDVNTLETTTLPALADELAAATAAVATVNATVAQIKDGTLPAIQEAIAIAQASADSTVKVWFEDDLGDGVKPTLNDGSDLGDLYYRSDGQVERWLGSSGSGWVAVEDTVLASTIEALRGAEAQITELNTVTLPALSGDLAAAEAVILTHGEDLSGLDNRLQVTAGELADAKSDLNAAESLLNEAQSAITDLGLATENLGRELGLVETTVGQHANALTGLDERLAGAEADVLAAGQAVDAAQGALSTLNSTTLPALNATLAEKLPKAYSVGVGTETSVTVRDVLTFSSGSESVPENIVIHTNIPTLHKMVKVRITGYNYSTQHSEIDLTTTCYVYNDSAILWRGASSTGSAQIDVRFALADGRLALVLSPPVGGWMYVTLEVPEVTIMYVGADKSQAEGWTAGFYTEQAVQGMFSLLEHPEADRDLHDTNLLTQGWRTTGTTTIDGGKITADSVTADQIKANTIGATEIAANAIYAGAIQADAVTANAIKAGEIVAGKLATNAVVADNIQADAITAEKIAAGTITAEEISGGTITGDKIAGRTISAENLLILPGNEFPDGYFSDPGAWPVAGGAFRVEDATFPGGHALEVQTLDQQTGAYYRGGVHTAQLEAGETYRVRALLDVAGDTGSTHLAIVLRANNANNEAVFSIAYLAIPGVAVGRSVVDVPVVAPHGANGLTAFGFFTYGSTAGGTYRIGDLSVRRMSGGTLIENGAISTDKVQANAINADKLQVGAITADKAIIANGAILSAQIQDAAITTAKIGEAQIVSAHIGELSATKITSGVIHSDRIGANTITAEKLLVADFTNYFTDPDFAGDFPGWARVGRAGVWGIEKRGNGAQTGAYVFHASIDVRAGEQYVVSATRTTVEGAATGQATIHVISNNGYIGEAVTLHTDERKTGARITVPEGVHVLHLGFYTESNIFADQLIRITDVVVRRLLSGELIVDGSIVGDKIKANTITANEMKTGTITADSGIIGNAAIIAANIGEAQITNAHIEGLSATKITTDTLGADRIGAKTITTEKLVIGDFTNAVEGGDMETPEVLSISQGGSNGLVQHYPWAGYGSASSVSFSGHDPGGYGSLAFPPMTLAPGATYRLSYRLWRSTGTTINYGPRIAFLDGSNFAGEASGTPEDQWGEVSHVITVPPVATGGTLRFDMGCSGGSALLDDVRLVKMASAELIVDGAITALKIGAEQVTADAMAANSITALNIQTGAITAQHLDVGSVTASSIGVGAVVAGTIATDAVLAANIKAGEIKAEHIAANQITTKHIDAGFGGQLDLTANTRVNFVLGEAQKGIGDAGTVAGNLDAMQKVYSFTPQGATITTPTSPYSLALTNEGIAIQNSAHIDNTLVNGVPVNPNGVVSYWNADVMHVDQFVGEIVHLGNHQIRKTASGTIVKAVG